MKPKYDTPTAPTRKETPLDLVFREAFSKLIQPGFYISEMLDESMNSYIPKGALLLLEEDQATGSTVELVWKKQRFIRKCVSIDSKRTQFVPFPKTLSNAGKYKTLTRTEFNMKDIEILGTLRGVLYFGQRRSKKMEKIISEIKITGDIRKLLEISEFTKWTRVGKIEL